MILAEAVTFDPGVVIFALVVLTAIAIAAFVWTIFAIRFGYQFGRAISDRRRTMKWAGFSLPFVLLSVIGLVAGDAGDFAWYLGALAVVVGPPLVGRAVQQSQPDASTETGCGSQPGNDDS